MLHSFYSEKFKLCQAVTALAVIAFFRTACADGNGLILSLDGGVVGLGMTEPMELRSEKQGNITLSVSHGAEHIIILENVEGVTNKVVLPKTWQVGEESFAPNLFVQGVSLSGDDTVGDTVLMAVFDDGGEKQSVELALTVVSCSVTIWSRQPGGAGSREAVFWKPGGLPDIGHAGWRFSCSHPKALPAELREFVNVSCGFMRGNSRMSFVGALTSAPGLFVMPDSGEAKATASYTKDISPGALISGLRYNAGLHTNPGDYNPNTRNCADAAIAAGEAAGLIVPKTIGTWMFGGRGANPGDLGEDLRALESAETKKPDEF